MPRRGGRRKKTRTHVVEDSTNDDHIPRSIIFRQGKVSLPVKTLIQNLRKVMSPYTAENLREKKDNPIKELLKLSGLLNVTHLIAFSSSENYVNMKIARTPHGPTLSFRVDEFSLIKQVRELQRKPVDVSSSFRSPAIVILNNFGRDEHHIKAMNVTFQNMFPPVDIEKIKLSNCRRVVLFNYNSEQDRIEFRHYHMKATPVGVSRTIKKIVYSKIPNLERVEDISEALNYDAGYSTGGETEDETTHVILPDKYHGRGNEKSAKSAIKLSEIGPRMSLRLMKVEREICAGDVLYHSYIKKDPKEAAKAKQKKEQSVELKRKRREEQEKNVERKKQAIEEKKKAKKEKYLQKQSMKKMNQENDQDDE